MSKFKVGKWYYPKKPTAIQIMQMKREARLTGNSPLKWTSEMDILEGRTFQCTSTFRGGNYAFLADGFASCGLHISWAVGPFETKEEAREAYIRSLITVVKRPDPWEVAMRKTTEKMADEMARSIDKEIIDTLIEEDLPAIVDNDESADTVRKKYGQNLSADIKVHGKLWRKTMQDHVNKSTLKSEEKYLIPVRASDSRVEELPSGKTVFYVNVGMMPKNEVPTYLEKVRKDLFRECKESLTNHFQTAVQQDPTLAQELKALEKDYDARIRKIWSD